MRVLTGLTLLLITTHLFAPPPYTQKSAQPHYDTVFRQKLARISALPPWKPGISKTRTLNRLDGIERENLAGELHMGNKDVVELSKKYRISNYSLDDFVESYGGSARPAKPISLQQQERLFRDYEALITAFGPKYHKRTDQEQAHDLGISFKQFLNLMKTYEEKQKNAFAGPETNPLTKSAPYEPTAQDAVYALEGLYAQPAYEQGGASSLQAALPPESTLENFPNIDWDTSNPSWHTSKQDEPPDALPDWAWLEWDTNYPSWHTSNHDERPDTLPD